MTGYADNIYSGLQALNSAQASYSPVRMCRTFRFPAGGIGNQSFVLPTGVQNLDAKCYILANGSAATTDTITVSAGGVNLIVFSSMGSATGVVRSTTVGLGTLTTTASACANLSTTAEVSADIKINSTDTATDYQVELQFSRLRVDPMGNP